MGDGTAIVVQGLSKWYGSWQALYDISLNVEPGRCTVLCGPSGSGKSTLLRCMNGLEEWEQGEVYISGQKLGHRAGELRRLRRRVGMVFQNFNLFPHLSVRDNVALPPRVNLGVHRNEAEARAMHNLDIVGVAEHADKFPDQLSGGQQQRVAIARALAMQPEILLFDEPTSALDPESISEVLEVMVNLALDGTTMIVVTHEMGFARRVCHDVVFMDRGYIVETAPPDTFFDCPCSDRAKEFIAQICH